jgi:SAM-dependent methyltransferase
VEPDDTQTIAVAASNRVVILCVLLVLRRVYQRVLGHPFVYNHVRPRVIGGIDPSPLYKRLEKHHVILDVGCGTGDALNYLDDFESFTGYDTDPVAIDFARKTHGHRARARFEHGAVTADHIAQLGPTAVILSGLLHHLPDDEALELLRMVQTSSRLRTIVTQDVVYVPQMFVNNLFARLDRGRYCRKSDGYEALARGARLNVCQAGLVPAHPRNKHVVYFMMTLTPNDGSFRQPHR